MALRLFYVFLLILIGILAYRAYIFYDARQSLTNPPATFVFGPEDADLVVNEFLDYACPYCKEVHPALKEAIAQDGNVRLAPRPLLSRNPNGTGAAYIFYAAGMSGKAEEAHNFLMENEEDITDERLPEIAETLGIEFEEFKANLTSTKTRDYITDNYNTFNTFGGSGTPTFFIGPDLMYMSEDGLPDTQKFLELFDEARAMQ